MKTEEKLDMILSEISKLNFILPDEIKHRKQANELPKSDEHFFNQLNRCKPIVDSCEFNVICNIFIYSQIKISSIQR